MPSIHDFATWEPVPRLLRAADAENIAAPGGYVAGRIGRHGSSLPMPRRRPQPGRALQIEDMQDEFDAVERVRGALADAGVDDISFAAEISRDGSAVLHLLHPSPAAEPGIGNAHPGSLILVEDAVPEPWRRLPEPVPAAVAAPSVDPASLERTLRERIPDAIGATEAEIAAAEARLGVVLPDELKVLYRVTRARWEDRGDDYEAAERVSDAVGCELLSLDELYIADAPSRPSPWKFAAMKAVGTPPDAAVQGLVGSPGWIVFGDNGGGDLLADSLTDLVSNGLGEGRRGPRGDQPPAVARVNIGSLSSVEAAVHPDLEVLSIGVWEGEPLSLAPVTGLPRLRTLTAYPGTLADPLEIADPLPIVALANELLALWDRPPITRTTLEGNLGPVA
ncbi:SMI1/KNR4 family protein [Streptomyces mirabilis]|uniref:SMI1/KNR4 family protein n=1 Tax=Streptomyces mirabilis TaxID=68239 RepID=UPI00365E76BA